MPSFPLGYETYLTNTTYTPFESDNRLSILVPFGVGVVDDMLKHWYNVSYFYILSGITKIFS